MIVLWEYEYSWEYYVIASTGPTLLGNMYNLQYYSKCPFYTFREYVQDSRDYSQVQFPLPALVTGETQSAFAQSAQVERKSFSTAVGINLPLLSSARRFFTAPYLHHMHAPTPLKRYNPYHPNRILPA